MDTEGRIERVLRHCVEVLTREEARTILESNDRPRAYIGFEPSGRLTIGHLVTARKMRDLQEAGCELTVFLADWHAWINDKLGGDLERIRGAGEYMRAVFTALGVDAETAIYRWANDLVASREYWSRVVRIDKATTLARTKRAMTIMGRGEDEANLDTAKLLYPGMQAADIFELPVDLAYAGLDQRRAHVLAREVAHHYGWPTPVALHTPLISSLKGGGRMDPATMTVEGKMSKSDPTSAITIPSSGEEIRNRLNSAFCPAKEVEGNPVVEIARHIVFAWEGSLEVPNLKDASKSRRFEEEAGFLRAWSEGELHPKDLKDAVAASLTRILTPAREYLERHPEVISP